MIPIEIKDGIIQAQELMFITLRMLFESDGPLTLESMKKMITDSKELCLRLNLIDRCVKHIRMLGQTAAMMDGDNGLPYENEAEEMVGLMDGMSRPPRGPAPMESQDMLGGLLGFVQNTLGGAVREKALETLAATLVSLNMIKNLTLSEKARINTIKTSLINQLEKQVADHVKPKTTASELDIIPPAPEVEPGDEHE